MSPRYVNSYIFETPRGLAVLDCGVNDERCHATLSGAIEELGGTVAMVIGSHLHIDHIGMARRLVAETGAQWIMHESTPTEIPIYNDWISRRDALVGTARQHGAPEEFCERVTNEWLRPDWYDDAVAPTHPVRDGDTIDLGNGRGLRVVYTPGHQQNHICLVDSVTGNLFSGDHILGKVSPFVPYRRDRDTLEDYLRSIRRITDTALTTTQPGHGDSLEHGPDRAKAIGTHHEERLNAMLEMIDGKPKTAWDVMLASFRPNLGLSGQRLAISETLAHLYHLANQGRATIIQKEGATQFWSE